MDDQRLTCQQLATAGSGPDSCECLTAHGAFLSAARLKKTPPKKKKKPSDGLQRF